VDDCDKLLPAGLKLLSKFSAKSRSAIALAKRVVYEGGNMALHDGLALESEIFGLAWGTEDRVEGITAYMEKRKPRFKG
jgi:enoyl-CoA hydratase